MAIADRRKWRGMRTDAKSSKWDSKSEILSNLEGGKPYLLYL